MARTARGVNARAKHKKILDLAKGYRSAASRVFRVANQAVIKAGQYAYRDRRQRRRLLRQLWIVRINAAARLHQMTYHDLISGLQRANIEINRKMLSELAVNHRGDQGAFARLVEQARAQLGQGKIKAA